ncbi:MAG: hypothetical protein EPN21_00510 [Methylococcaceae bacterium]|nr:MAG: hypothetical protein EPN21_00510 [Methylococcaceae bacterium]
MDTTIPDETLTRLLPASCRLLLQDGLPLAAVLRLIYRYGGGPVCVPCTVEESSELAQAIGLEAAQKLSAKCANSSFYVPRAHRLQRYCRDKAILQAYTEGQIIRDIAQVHRVSDRTVATVIARDGKPNRQVRRRGARS